MTTRTQWVARCACRSSCEVELTYDDEASARRMVEYYRVSLQRPYTLVRQSTVITETVIYPPAPEAT